MNMRINTRLKQNREYSRHGYVDEVRKKSGVGLVVTPEGSKFWCNASFHPPTVAGGTMNFVRRIESTRKVSKISFMVYWRHYG